MNIREHELVAKSNAAVATAQHERNAARRELAVTRAAIELTPEELRAAEAAGKTPTQWASLKGVKTLDDWEAHRARGGSA